MGVFFEKIENDKYQDAEYYPTTLGWAVIIGLVLAICGLTLFGLAKIAGAAWTYEQNWNTLNEGDLNGQNNWQRTDGSQSFLIQSSGAYEGKALYIPIEADVSTNYFRSITPTMDGDIYFLWKLPTDNRKQIKYSFTRSDGGLLFYVVSTNYGYYPDNCAISIQTNDTTPLGTFNCNTWALVNIQYTGSSVKGRAKASPSGDWSGWSNWASYRDGRYNSEITKINISNYGEPGQGSGSGMFDAISSTDLSTPPPPTLEFIKPSNNQTFPDFSAWQTKTTYHATTSPPQTMIVGYSGTGIENVKYDWDTKYTTNYPDEISWWDFFKHTSLPDGTYTAKLFLHQADSIYAANPENLISESDEITFYINHLLGSPTPTPYLPSPSPQFSTTTWTITSDYVAQDYVSNVPAIFGTTTPYGFYTTISNGFINFVKPFAEFTISIKNWLIDFTTQGYGDKARYLLAFASYNLNKIFPIPIIPIVSTYILFILVFFVIKFIFKILRG